jgi:hypothetical protein
MQSASQKAALSAAFRGCYIRRVKGDSARVMEAKRLYSARYNGFTGLHGRVIKRDVPQKAAPNLP